jgi:hypothetical protein
LGTKCIPGGDTRVRYLRLVDTGRVENVYLATVVGYVYILTGRVDRDTEESRERTVGGSGDLGLVGMNEGSRGRGGGEGKEEKAGEEGKWERQAAPRRRTATFDAVVEGTGGCGVSGPAGLGLRGVLGRFHVFSWCMM